MEERRRKWPKTEAVPLKFHHLLILLSIFSPTINGLFADYATIPKGTNPTLYDSADFVVQLDEQTFNDTVFCSSQSPQNDEHGQREQRCTSLVVEFYSDWCGHCRAYARVYKTLAKDLLGWSQVVKLAAINCADPINLMTCRSSGITHYPFIKYFPRNSTFSDEGSLDGAGGQLLRSFQSLAAMRDQFTRAILAEFETNRYEDWPNFDWLGPVETYGQLWEGVPETIQTMAIIFESNVDSLVGAQLLLDLSKYSAKIIARRSANSALANALQIQDFPTFAIFRRGERSPVHIAELRRLLLGEFEQFLQNETAAFASPHSSSRLLTFARRRGVQTGKEHFCNANPEICRKSYFVSELDMLKSVRMALFNDVHLGGNQISGPNLTALLQFVDLLANHFPYASQLDVEDANKIQFLNASSRARVVFSHLRDFIESKGSNGAISVDLWRAEFLRAELDQGNPFPVAPDWEHCRGSSPILRGYTCGLWTVFHALTVNSFKNGQKAQNQHQFHPIAILHAIRDWVGVFFTCEHCRAHFLKMTTKVARIESLVRQKEDVFLYLWRAHNQVNARLRGRETEDPQFPKYQFPPRFLCPECRNDIGNGTTSIDGDFDEAKVKKFLLAYYSNVRPIIGGGKRMEDEGESNRDGPNGKEEIGADEEERRAK